MDNSKPIPEPILSNVKEYLENNPNCTLLEAATYGYNIAQVFVDDLKTVIKQHVQAIKELRESVN